MSDPVFEITLEDGRKILLEEQNETLAREAGRRWARLNPADGGEIGIYEVTIGDRTVKVPAVSEEAAVEFTQAWGPQQRALEDARANQASASGVTLGEENIAYDATDNAVNGMTLGLDKIANAATNAGITGFQNLIGDGPGYGMSDAFMASRLAENEAQADYAADRPIESLGSGLLGGLATPGMGKIGEFVVGQQAGKGLLASENLLPAVGRGVAAGGPVGAVSGALNANPGDEARSAGRGAIVGGALGGGVPLASAAASGAVRATGLDQLPAVLNRATGGRVSALNGDVDRRALQRLSEAMRADRIEPAQIRTAMNDAMRYGVSPNLLDIVGPNATRTRMLVVGAAQKPGPGMTAGAQYRNEVAGSVQDQAIDQAYRLTPGETRSAVQYRQGLDDMSEQLARTDYAPIYDEQIMITPEVERALSGMTPQMRMAQQESSFRFPERATEIEGLANPDEVLDSVSAGALDRIQRQMGNAGRNATRSLENANPGLAADYYARQGAVNEALEAVPALGPARATYRGYNLAGEGVDLGQQAMTQSRNSIRPADYVDKLGVLEQKAQDAAVIANQPSPEWAATVGELPVNGVAPAFMGRDGRVYTGQIGTSHFNATSPELRAAGMEGSGFVTPDGRFLNRQEALAYVNSNGEKIRPNSNMPGELDALDYREQSAIAQSGEMRGPPPTRQIPTPRQGAQIGMRDQIVQDLGNMVEGATGPLNRLTNGQASGNARQVMEATYGAPAVDDFQGSLGLLGERMRIANFMDATRGSPSAGRLGAGEMGDIPRSPFAVAAAILSKIRRGATMTDADREALVRLSTQFGATPPTLAVRGVPVSGRLAPILAGQGG